VRKEVDAHTAAEASKQRVLLQNLSTKSRLQKPELRLRSVEIDPRRRWPGVGSDGNR
jgi:hypothetical protein